MATEQHSIAVVHWPEGELIAEAKSLAGRIRCVAISADGQTLAAGCDQGIVYVWNLESDRSLIAAVALAVDDSGGDQGITSVYIRSADDDGEQSGHPLRQAGDDKQLLVTAEDGSTMLWGLQQSNPRLPDSKAWFGIDVVGAVLPHGIRSVLERNPDVVFIRSIDGELARFDARSEVMTRIAQIDPDRAGCFAISDDERTIVAATPDDLVFVDVDSGEIVQADSQASHGEKSVLVWHSKPTAISCWRCSPITSVAIELQPSTEWQTKHPVLSSVHR